MHAGQMIMTMTSEIGHMLDDPTYLPSGITQEDIMNFFKTIITEYESSFQLKHADLPNMKSDINDYFDECTSEKNRLVAEEASEAAAEIVAGAAMVAATALSWLPGVNFALSATAIALEAVALGLEIAVEKLQGTVVEDISNADNKIRLKPAFAKIKVYIDAQTSNTTFFPRLQLGMTILEMRAAFLATVMTAKKELNRNITNKDLKNKFVDWYNLSKNDDKLVTDFSEMYDELEKASPEDLSSFSKKFDTAINSSVLEKYRMIAVGMVMSLTITLAIRKGKQFYKIYKSVNSMAKAFNTELGDLDSEGNVAEAGTESGEMEVLTGAEACSMAISFLAGVTSLLFGVLEAVKAKETDDVLTKAISDSKDAIIKYYEDLVNNSH